VIGPSPGPVSFVGPSPGPIRSIGDSVTPNAHSLEWKRAPTEADGLAGLWQLRVAPMLEQCLGVLQVVGQSQPAVGQPFKSHFGDERWGPTQQVQDNTSRVRGILWGCRAYEPSYAELWRFNSERAPRFTKKTPQRLSREFESASTVVHCASVVRQSGPAPSVRLATYARRRA
jgi:hypothetical protein